MLASPISERLPFFPSVLSGGRAGRLSWAGHCKICSAAQLHYLSTAQCYLVSCSSLRLAIRQAG